MRQTTLMTVLTAALLFTGCCKNKTEATGSEPILLPATVDVAPAAKRFEGTYKSNWGTTTFRETGASVTAQYPRGSMTCSSAGDTLSCDWVEGGLRGKASLTRQANGDIAGTWGSGSSATDGGPWSFTRVSGTVGAVESEAALDFSGKYRSNWGTTTFTQTGSTVRAVYSRGTMTCNAAGNVLSCTWYEGSGRGAARLVRKPDGSMQGTWGNGSSASNGGAWSFVPL